MVAASVSASPVVCLETPPNGENAQVPQSPNVASAVSSWTRRLIFSVELLSLRTTTDWSADVHNKDASIILRTLFSRADALHNHENPCTDNIVSAIDKVL